MTHSVPTMTLQELLDEYVDAAMTHRTATRRGDHRTANPAYEQLVGVIRELRTRGAEAQAAFVTLLDDERLEVRGWAAAHALEFASDKAEAVLGEIVAGPQSLEEFSARRVLEEWRGGRLRFP